MGRVRRTAYREAAGAAFQGQTERTAWEHRIVVRQQAVRKLYLTQAQLLGRSGDPADRALGAKVEAFVRGMPRPDTLRLALARGLRAANEAMRHRHLGDGKDRSR
jgi:hypothetical protein